jgi:fatty acid desaturase
MGPTNSRTSTFWREPKGALPNSLALFYAFGGHVLGLWLLTYPHPGAFIVGILLTAHSMIIAAYLVHECAHQTLFRSRRMNARVGEALLWETGAAYASFERVRRMHLRHHRDRADVACFDYQAALRRAPRPLRWLVHGLEWCYVPAVELFMHYQVLVRPFLQRHLRGERRRVLWMLATRFALFAGLYAAGPWALLGYALAYVVMLHALFLADAFAHTYETHFVLRGDEPVVNDGRGREYDVAHSYSNLVSTRFPWLNVLNLNFGYHTAHHQRAAVPWYQLPRVHRELFRSLEHSQVLTYRELWRSLHRNRLRRILAQDYGHVGQGPGRADGFTGAHGVSFLTVV